MPHSFLVRRRALGVLAVAATTLFGFLNGILIAKFNMFPFVVTLATQLVIRGVAYIISGGYSASLANADFKNIGNGKLFSIIPIPVVILFAIAILAYIIMHWTHFGRYIYAVGGNMNSAIASGVNVFWTRTFSFTIMGFCAGVAGVIMTSRISAAQPNIGVGYETDAIAACVIGGTSFSGGIATIPGTMIGIVIIGIVVPFWLVSVQNKSEGAVILSTAPFALGLICAFVGAAVYRMIMFNLGTTIWQFF